MSFLRLLLIVVSIGMLSKSANAQQAKTTQVVKINKDSLSLVNRINKDSIKLVSLQSQIEEKTKAKEQTEIAAQKIADENNKIAKRLSKDPLEKKLAKKADKLSSEARASAKKARIAADALKSLNKSIVSLERKLVKDQSKLDKIRAVALVKL